MKSFSRTVLFLFFGIPALMWAQTGVPVKISAFASGTAAGPSPARYHGDPAEITLTATFLPSLPGASDAVYFGTDGEAGFDAVGLSIALQTVQLEPDKSYFLSVSGTYIDAFTLDVIPPPGYLIEINGERRSRYSNNAITTPGYMPDMFIRVISASKSQEAPVRAGAGSSLAGDRIYWEAGMGSLLNGTSAGKIRVIDTGLGSGWAHIFTPAVISYEAPSDEVTVHRAGGNISQIIAKEAVVDVEIVNSAKFKIKFYHPEDMVGSSYPYTFEDDPFVEYTFEGTGTTLLVTSVARSTDDTSVGSMARTATATLARSGSAWPAFTWTRRDWTTESETPLTEIVSTSIAGTGDNRNHSISVQGYNGGTVASRMDQVFTPLSSWGEFLLSQTLGTSTGLTTAYLHHGSTPSSENFGSVASEDGPGGSWTAYDYYNTSSDEAGAIKYRYRPFKVGPTSISTDPAEGEVTYYEYLADPFGIKRRPSLIETKIDNTLTGRSVISYTNVSGTINGKNVVEAERKDYSDATYYLTTRTRYYREDCGDYFLRNQVHSIHHPTGVKVSYAYQRGSLSGTTFTKSGSDGLGAGTASRIAVITGSASTGTIMSSYDGYAIGDVYLVTGKSTLEITLRDERALVVRRETQVWDGDSWELIAHTNFAYNYAGQLTEREASNGGTYAATYSGQQLASETDETGVQVTYGYDVEGRLQTATKVGGPTTTTTYGYDAAGRVTSTTVSGTGTGETIVTLTAYDNAGRVISVTPPGQTATTIAYNAGSRTRTLTTPDAQTRVETYQIDGRLDSITGSAVVSQDYTYDIDGGQLRTRVDHGSSTRWQKSWQDFLGRPIKTERPGFSVTSQPNYIEQSTYNTTTGLLSKIERLQSTGGRLYADTLFQYDELGQVIHRGLDIDTASSGLVLSSIDRIVSSNRSFENYASAWWLREETKTYAIDNNLTPHVASLVRTRLTGLGSGLLAETQTTTTNGAVITRTVTAVPSTKTVTVTTSQAGIDDHEETVVNGLPTTITTSDGLVFTTGYDELGRPNTSVDPRTGTTTTVYKTGTTLPQTITDARSLLISYQYDTSARKTRQGNADSKYAYFSYNVRGQLERQWGATVSPVEHVYDNTYGDHTGLKTYQGGTGWDGTSWPGSPGTADTTTWAYDAASGLLSSKTDALTRAVTYTYNARGQLHVRTTPRSSSVNATATHGYDNNTGELTSVTYGGVTTPSVAYRRNRLGHVYEVDDATGTRSFDLCACGRVNHEDFDNAFYGDRVLAYEYEGSGGMMGRYKGFELISTAAPTENLEQTYGFTSGGRFEDIATARHGSSRTFLYDYVSNSRLVDTLRITSGHSFIVDRDYESNRDLAKTIDSKWTTASMATQTRFDYAYTDLMQRKTAKQSGSAFEDYGTTGYSSVYNVYSYNDRGEVESAALYRGNSGGTVTATPAASDELPGRHFEYRYDSIGNRTSTRGTANSTSDDDDYASDVANQYSTKENNVLRITGTIGSNANVALTIGSTSISPDRLDRAWAAKHVPANSSDAVKVTATVHSADPGGGTSGEDLVGVTTKSALVPKRSQGFDYDYAGNLTDDGIWIYTYDAENRLVTMQTDADAIGTGRLTNADALKLEFTYDYLGRRVQKIVRDGYNGSSFTTVKSNRKYLYDGWNLIAEFNAVSTLTLVKSYTWGLDVSGSLTATGGVGALLQIRDHALNRTWLPTYDGNGNVVSLLDAEAGSGGAIGAVYEYGPFGEPLRAEIRDVDAAEVSFRFSTKFTDAETGLVYYGLRYYSPALGRFINRDPIEEQGGLNLYGFAGNDGVNGSDYLGMFDGLVMNIPWNQEAEPLPGIRFTYIRHTYVSAAERAAQGTVRGWFPAGGDIGGGVESAGATPEGEKTKAAPNTPERWSDEKCKGLAAQISASATALQATLDASNEGRSYLGTSRDYFVNRRTTTPFNPVEAISTAGDSLTVAGLALMPWGDRTGTASMVLGTVSNVSSTALAGYSFQQGDYGGALMYGVGAATDLASVAATEHPGLRVVTTPVDIGKGILASFLILNDQYQSAGFQYEAEQGMKAHFDRMQKIETSKRSEITSMENQYNEHCK